ncbi:DNA-binding transcriptional regulator, LysR family [Ectothiorhodospira magna]|uniref:DNA-binding transcriptional regulator, LysR family n=1 Tax=Ectothiorhodospira magna TaxID=867345 RepID=A0A1H9ADL0_9GAMM|nr:LysR family transcriptional regulator [Ectothiorhodospira magna]SEP74740.1 DNA-binding transcriptional regulator, LysR family [Ectothiorhodospira magna]
MMLEQDLGLRLTRQSGGRLSLSEVGQCYADYGERILSLSEEAREAAQSLSSDRRRNLCVWISHEMAWGWAIWVMNDFLARYPEYSLEARVLLPGAQPPLDEVDVWLACGQVQAHGLACQPLGRWQRRLYAASDPDACCCHLEDPDQIERCAWIELTGESEAIHLRHRDSGHSRYINPHARLRVNSLQTLADGIARGYGVGMLPAWVAECPRHGIMRGRLARILADWEIMPTDLFMLVRSGLRSKSVECLTAHMKSQLPVRWRL